MKFNYVDIGTSDFETSLDVKKEDENVLLVEPLFYYLAKFKNSKNIFKANFAISNHKGYKKIYHVTEENIKTYNLPYWVKGCNSIDRRHPTVENLLLNLNLPLSIVDVSETLTLTFKDLLELYDINHINNLKIDTESHDHIILESVFDCVCRKSVEIDTITFEYIQQFNNTEILDKLSNKFISELGYKFVSLIGDNFTISKI